MCTHVFLCTQMYHSKKDSAEYLFNQGRKTGVGVCPSPELGGWYRGPMQTWLKCFLVRGKLMMSLVNSLFSGEGFNVIN